ncbi:MAG: iron ABC transporter permease [Phycisphaeraceae bacterium]|nr:iron ABC transporter permease [Phycisphaeraceae bacterium]
MLLAVAFLLVLVGYPVVMLLLQSIWPDVFDGRLDDFLAPYGRMFSTPGIPEMLWNSFRWAAATTVGSWLLGIPCGYLLARTNLRGKAFLRLSLLVPIMTPPYILAICYVLIMQPAGLADRTLGGMPEAIRATFFSFWGVTLVMALAGYGYVGLATEAALRGLSTRLEDAAQSLGATWSRRAWTILLPLLLPAILNSGLLVFLDAISNFGVPAVLGPRANLPLLPAEIYYLLTSWPIDIPLATALSTLLLVLAVIGVLLSRWLLGGREVHSGRTTMSRQLELPRWATCLAWAFALMLFVLSIGLPYGTMVLVSLVDRWGEGMPTWTLDHYRLVFSEKDGGGLGALWTSLWLSLSAAAICCIVGGMIAWMVLRRTGTLARVLDVLGLLPRVLPKIVMAVALILAWSAPWIGIPIYNTWAILLIAYVALYMSDALRLGDTGLRQISERLEYAGASLGASPLRVFRTITFPLLRPAMFAAFLTTFVVCMRDLVASVLLMPAGMQTTGSYIFSQFEQGEVAVAMAMASTTIILSVVILMLLRLRLGRAPTPSTNA